MALPATEAFSAAAANLPDPPWTALPTNSAARHIKTNGSGLGEPVTEIADTDDIARWNADTFANDQYSQYVAKFTGGGAGSNYLYLLARNTGTDTHLAMTTYWFWSDGGSDTALNKFVGTTLTGLATANATAFTTGDVFKLICNGTTISVTKNGTTILSVTDSAVTTGSAAMGGSAVSLGSVLFDDWEGGNVAAGTTIPPGLGPVVSLTEPTLTADLSSMMR